ncbi:hypothetical protein BOO86_16990 [Mycobacterium sp. CBMA 234]|uniref:GGDEF domain-containing protein n=1 Tax=Mycolicibacterium sp. CBMA 234 TaxID=1918495 RepID=UPI0012DE4FD0|nr:GGDEF domain-containing protein [Mycolicibacterium sp. CBMA 234]MUL66173.1 hypothetical protein [Mycolicibacterium sp. CBMA 234]
MSKDWLLAVGLGTFAMGGIALLFVVVWVVDRSRTSALSFAGAIAAYSAGTVALSVPITAALASSIHGVVFPPAMLLLADGLLRRVGDRLTRWTVLSYLVPMIAIVWFFAYVSPLLVGRVVTQNLGTMLLLLAVVHQLRKRVPTTGSDRAASIAAVVLATALAVAVLVAPFSQVPRELLTRADLDSYMQTNLEMCLIVSGTIVLPSFMVTMLAITVIDMAQELQSQRDCDELTGLLNRRGFYRRAEAVLREASGCIVILADVDYFKAVNDSLGHLGGDEVLIALARILDDSLVNGRAVGRVGGEEFAVLLSDTSVESAVAWVEAAQVRLAARSLEISGGVMTVTASFGMAAGQSGAPLTDLITAADKALYRAKRGGRNQTVVSG